MHCILELLLLPVPHCQSVGWIIQWMGPEIVLDVLGTWDTPHPPRHPLCIQAGSPCDHELLLHRRKAPYIYAFRTCVTSTSSASVFYDLITGHAGEWTSPWQRVRGLSKIVSRRFLGLLLSPNYFF